LSVVDKLKSFFFRPKADPQAAGSSVSGNFSPWFSPYNMFTVRASNTLATNETIFAAVSRLSNSMGSLPLKLLYNFVPVSDHFAADLVVNSPNPNMNGFEFIRTLEAHRDTFGNAYALKEYDTKYQPCALWILDPNRVRPVLEKTTKELWYEVDGDNGRYYVHNLEMIHVKHIHAVGYAGISPIDVLKNTADFDVKVKEFSLEQIDSAVKASFILKMATNLNEDRKRNVLLGFQRFYQENGGVLIQEQGVDIKEIERKFIDTKVFEVERITRTRVASVYNMPAHLLGETEGVNYASMEQMSLEYVQNTLVPIATQYEREFNRKLLTQAERRSGYYFKFNLNSLLRGDMKTRGEFYFKGVRTGVFTPNECRAWEDLPPMELGDKLYLSGDLYPIDMEREKGTTPAIGMKMESGKG
jgi:HK97 family phage portal protein